MTSTAILSLSLFGAAAGVLQASSSSAPASSQGAAPRTERVVDLTIEEAVRSALTYNPGLAAATLTAESTESQIDVALGAFEPVLFATPRVSDSTTPSASQLAGAQNLERNILHLDTGIRQALPTGGSYSLTFQTDNERTNNSFQLLNPQTFSTFSINFTQPLLRNAWTGIGRIPQAQAENARDQAAADRERQKLDLIQQVYNAYWDLVFTFADRDVRRQSLALAERLLDINRRKVEQGLLAEVEIYQAQADVATRREALLTAENTIRAAEDALKQLLFPFDRRSEWSLRLRPTSLPPAIGSVPVPAWQDAVETALGARPDLERQRIAIRNLELDVERARSGVLPRLDFVATAGDAGLAARADQTIRDLIEVRYPNYSFAVTAEIPLGNLAARATERRTLLDASAARQQLRSLELQVVREVRDAVRQVTYGEEKVAAATKSREFAEKQLRAEELRFEQGLSTNFEVLSLQRDLAQAQTNEQRAILDYAKAAIALDRSKGTLLAP